ncbi:unnamed protein product, partial [Discosporangium mesarthrocarpum]
RRTRRRHCSIVGPSRRRALHQGVPPVMSTVDVEAVEVESATASVSDEVAEALKGLGNSRRRPSAQIRKELQGLLEEFLELVRAAGPEVGVRRTLQATRAVILTLRDLYSDWRMDRLTRPRAGGVGSTDLREARELDPSGVARALRGLFERMGATYIKLAQFIASSPTLFPAEYVMEFQKCLDATDLTPFVQINKIIREEV